MVRAAAGERPAYTAWSLAAQAVRLVLIRAGGGQKQQAWYPLRLQIPQSTLCLWSCISRPQTTSFFFFIYLEP